MGRRYVTADVFTTEIFHGNPLAVVLDAEGLSTADMQAITIEFNYSETTFVLPARDRSHTAWVRIFNPSREMPFAGHPNIGTAFVLARERQRRGETVPDRFVFEEAGRAGADHAAARGRRRDWRRTDRAREAVAWNGAVAGDGRAASGPVGGRHRDRGT